MTKQDTYTYTGAFSGDILLDGIRDCWSEIFEITPDDASRIDPETDEFDTLDNELKVSIDVTEEWDPESYAGQLGMSGWVVIQAPESAAGEWKLTR